MRAHSDFTPTPERLVPLLEQRIPQVMIQRSVPGLSAVLFSDTAIVWSQGFGVSNTVTQKPVTTETIFEGASLSKPVTAYAALKLCAQGKLALDRSLATYLSEDDELAASKITLQHVLSHSTGLPNWRGRSQPIRIQSEPGARFGYSGEGYVYLQRVIERITGQS
ncbi:MAG: serine hydrolase domain-containing protein, partial [Chloroflexota bacterium]